MYDLRQFDPNNPEAQAHYKAVLVAWKQLRPMTYFYKVGRPITYNLDNMPVGGTALENLPGWDEVTWKYLCFNGH